MESPLLRIGRWVVGGGVFVLVTAILFEAAAGQSSPRPISLRSNVYRGIDLDHRDVKTALNFALADQQKKNRSASAVTFIEVLTAEHQASNGDNYRLCLALDRHGRFDTVRAVVHRNQKRHWSVALWAWGACGK